jgi:hypothetical protein
MKGWLKALNERPVAMYPAYIKLTGSLSGGYLLSQCMYWFSKKDHFHKKDSDFMEELKMKPGEFKGAKNKLKALDFLKITAKGMPAKTYYFIDWEKFKDALESQFGEIHQTGEIEASSLANLTKQECQNSPNKNGEIQQSIPLNTKTTPEKKNKKDADALLIFEYWVKKFNKRKTTVFDAERKKKVLAALEIYPVEDCFLAIDGCAISPHHNGQNQTGQKYNELELIFRKPTKTDFFIELAENKPVSNSTEKAELKKHLHDRLRAGVWDRDYKWPCKEALKHWQKLNQKSTMFGLSEFEANKQIDNYLNEVFS